jgi:hypothetical protein
MVDSLALITTQLFLGFLKNSNVQRQKRHDSRVSKVNSRNTRRPIGSGLGARPVSQDIMGWRQSWAPWIGILTPLSVFPCVFRSGHECWVVNIDKPFQNFLLPLLSSFEQAVCSIPVSISSQRGKLLSHVYLSCGYYHANERVKSVNSRPLEGEGWNAQDTPRYSKSHCRQYTGGHNTVERAQFNLWLILLSRLARLIWLRQ